MSCRKASVLSVVLSNFVVSLGVAHAQLQSGREGPSFGQVNPAQMARMVNPAEDGPFYMINLIQYREKAVYPDGRETDLTGEEANNLYNPIGILREIGAEIVFMAQVEKMRLGDGTEWDQVAIVRYPSRRAFVQMTQRPDFQARSIHKDAGVGRTIVMVSHLVDSPSPGAPTPPKPTQPVTAGDRPFEMVQVFRFRDPPQAEGGAAVTTGREAMEQSGASSGAVATPMGVDPTALFEVEGVLIGDGRAWSEVRISRFPSRAALEGHLANERRAATEPRRAAGIEDSYSMQTRPMINRLGSP